MLVDLFDFMNGFPERISGFLRVSNFKNQFFIWGI